MIDSGIYVILNIVNNKVYVGSTKNFTKRKSAHFNLLVKNKHWNVKLQRSFNKHGIENFMFKIIEYCEYEKHLIISRENYFIKKFNAKHNGYNIADASFGDTKTGHPRREEIIQQTIETLKYNASLMTEDERSQKYGKFGEANGMFGKTHSKESIIQGSLKLKQFKIINGFGVTKGLKKSIAHRRKISDRAKLAIGELNPFFNKHHTDQTKKILSEMKMGKRPNNIRPFYIDGVLYQILEDAAKIYNVHATTIRHRLNSNNPKFESYCYIDDITV